MLSLNVIWDYLKISIINMFNSVYLVHYNLPKMYNGVEIFSFMLFVQQTEWVYQQTNLKYIFFSLKYFLPNVWN